MTVAADKADLIVRDAQGVWTAMLAEALVRDAIRVHAAPDAPTFAALRLTAPRAMSLWVWDAATADQAFMLLRENDSAGAHTPILFVGGPHAPALRDALLELGATAVVESATRIGRVVDAVRRYAALPETRTPDHDDPFAAALRTIADAFDA